ncbi:MAG: hypothetical protein ACE5J2_05440 [Nitrososphaerales archaeon]
MAYRSKKGNIATIGAAAIAIALAVSLVTANWSTVPVLAEHKPANKIAVASNGVQVLDAATIEAQGGVVLATGTFKANNPTDLKITYFMECGLYTGMKLKKNTEGTYSEAKSQAAIDIQITIDGTNVVAVSSAEPQGRDRGAVTFCDRTYYMKTNILNQIAELCTAVFDDPLTEEIEGCTGGEPFLDTFIETKSTHGFAWIALNVGQGLHTIEVNATVVEETSSTSGSEATATAIVGKNILLVEPDKFANDAEV